MSDIDNLQIKISAEANSASKSLDGLSQKLGSLASSLRGVNTSGIKSFANAMNTLTNAMKGIKDVNASQFTKVAKGISKFGQIDAVKIASVSNSMRPLAQSINSLNGISFNSGSISSFINSLAKLSNTNVSSLNSVNFTQLGYSIRSMATALSGAPEVSRNTISFTSSVAKLGASGATIGYVSNELPRLGTTLRQFIYDMSKVKNVSEPTIQFTNSIGQLASAGARTKATATNLRKLSTELYNFFNVMSKAPQVSLNTIRMTEALSRLNSQSIRFNTSNRGVSSGLNKFSIGANRASKSAKGLASSFGMFYAKFWLVLRAFRGMGKMIGLSSALTEVQNVVDVAFADMAYKINDFSKEVAMSDYGMSELTAKKIASRYQAMGNAINLSTDSIQNANTYLEGVTNGYVKASNSAADMSINLTKLAADMASFYDVDQESVAEDLQAVYTGMVRPLRKYGLDLTNATLQEWAMSQGMQANMKTMSQAEKTMLRYQYVLSQTTNAQGDYLRTIDTFANRLRLLKNQFIQLGTTLGGVFVNLLKPILRALNTIMDAVNEFAEFLANTIGKLLGWTLVTTKGGVASDLEDASGYGEDLEDSLGGASDKAKKLKQQLQGIDELNVLSSDNGDAGGAGGGGGLGDLGGAGNSNENGSAFKVGQMYRSFIDNVYELGEYLNQGITDALNSIDWDKAYDSAKGFGTGLADFLNGLISPELFGAVGKTIAGSLNTALSFLNSFGTTFEWKEFGQSISDGINKFFETFNFKLYADTISKFALGLTDALIKAVDEIKWDLVGKQIGTFLANLDIGEILSNLFTLAGKLIDGLVTALGECLAQAPLETLFVGAFVALKLTGAGAAIANTIFSQFHVSASTAAIGASSGTGILATIGQVIGGGLAIAAAIYFGYKFGEMIGEYLQIDKVVEKIGDAFFGGEDYDPEEEIKGSYEEYRYIKNKVKFGGTVSDDELERLNEYEKKYETAQDKLLDMADNSKVISLFPNAKENIKKEMKLVDSGFKKIEKGSTLTANNLDKLSNSAHESGNRTATSIIKHTSDIIRSNNSMSKSATDETTKTINSFKNMGTGVSNSMNAISMNTSSTNAIIGNSFNTLANNVTSSSMSARKGVENQYSIMNTNTSNSVTSMSNTTASNFNNMNASATSNSNSIKNNTTSAFASMGAGVSSQVTAMSSNALNSFNNLRQNTSTSTEEIKNSTINKFSQMNNGVDGKMGEIRNMILNSLHKSKQDIDGENWNPSGRSLVDGLKSGINTRWNTGNNSLITLVVNLASSLTSSLRNALGINSPSRVWRDEIGVYLPQGLAVGIEKGEGSVIGAMETLVDDMNATMSGVSVYNPLEAIEKSSYTATVGMQFNKKNVDGLSSGNIKLELAGQYEQNELLRQQNDLLLGILNKETSIQSSDIFNAVRTENRRFYNQTGKNALAY